MERLFRSLKSEWIPALGYRNLPEAQKDIGGYLKEITTAGTDLTRSMAGYRRLWLKKNLKHCPGLVDHYRSSLVSLLKDASFQASMHASAISA